MPCVNEIKRQTKKCFAKWNGNGGVPDHLGWARVFSNTFWIFEHSNVLSLWLIIFHFLPNIQEAKKKNKPKYISYFGEYSHSTMHCLYECVCIYSVFFVCELIQIWLELNFFHFLNVSLSFLGDSKSAIFILLMPSVQLTNFIYFRLIHHLIVDLIDLSQAKTRSKSVSQPAHQSDLNRTHWSDRAKRHSQREREKKKQRISSF